MRSAVLCLAIFGTETVAQIGSVTTLQVDKNLKVKQALFEDVNGDGVRDLIVAVSERGREYSRSLRIHHGKPGPRGQVKFKQTPDATAPVPDSISAFAIADVHADAGPEIVWFGARGAYVYRPRAPERERELKLVDSEFLYQYPHPAEIRSWQVGVRDLDADGLADLLLPEPTGYRIAFQRRAGAAVTFVTAVLSGIEATPRKSDGGAPVSARRDDNGFSVDFSLGGAVKNAPSEPLVSIRESVPAPQLHDWDADGDLDVIAKSGERVLVWQQTAKGVFATTPSKQLTFPIEDKHTKLDPRFRALLVDYTNDRRVDAVVIAKDRFSKEIRTQVLFFPQIAGAAAPLFAKGKPRDVLVLAGFSTLPRMQDIDGDGAPDLAIGSWRIDALDQLTAGENQSIDVEINVFLNRRGRFARRPNLSHRATISGDVLSQGVTKLFARFAGDVTGDSVSDLLVRDRPDRLRILMVRRRGETLTVIDRPLWEFRIAKEAIVRDLPASAKRPGLLIREENQVLLVTF